MYTRKIVLFFFMVGLVFLSYGQVKTNTEFNNERLKINKTGMIVLSSWAAANITVGAIGWATSSGESKYFNQMNVFWNIVNLGIALPGLFDSKKDQTSSNGKLIKEQYSNEQVYLLNNALNVLYISSGALLKSIANSHPDDEIRYQGYGNALILQGGFLLVFDLVQYLRHRSHRKESKSIFFDQLSLSGNNFGLKYSFK